MQNNTILSLRDGTSIIMPERTGNMLGGLKIQRHFSKETGHPYNLIQWEKRDVRVMDWKTNPPKVISERIGVETPAHWDENAVRITVDKYLFGSKPGSLEYENSLRDAFNRIANTYTVWGWQEGYFTEFEDASIFNEEIKHMLVNQMWAPNSPVWFNIGHWEQWRWGRPDLRDMFRGKGNPAYFSKVGDGKTLVTTQAEANYANPQMSACFLTEVGDSMEDILNHLKTEGRIFASGSGVGINLSTLRSSYEPIKGKGRSSGPLSFNKGWDRMAGAIKSGGKCLAPWQKVYTQNGPVDVKTLAEQGGHFVCLSYDPTHGRIMAKPAIAWKAGEKPLVEITTDKGVFALSPDHPVRLADETILHAGEIQEGMALHAGSVDFVEDRYLRIHLQNGKKGKELFHRLIAQDIKGVDIKGISIHHKDENTLNNNLDNLEPKTQSKHAGDHGRDTAAKGEHIFQKNKFPKFGENNAMHHTSDFWSTKEAQTYKDLQGDILKRSGRATAMQKASSEQRMLNLAWGLINAGYNIDTFDQYIEARKKVNGKIYSISGVKKDIEKYFGNYAGMVDQLTARNHRVMRVRRLDNSEVYDVEVTCPSPDDKTAASGHNFLIWSNTNDTNVGSGIFVMNTRRAARMVLLYSDHPDIFAFVEAKKKQEDIAKIILRDHNVQIELREIAKNKLMDGTPQEKAAARMILALPIANEIKFSPHMDDLLYGDTLSDQNANHSVSLKGDFWKAFNTNGDYATRWVTNPNKIHQTYKPEELLQLMAKAVWENGEPGVHNNDWINLWNPVKEDGEISTSNPCCFVGETNVFTDEGNKTIQQLQQLVEEGKPLPRAMTKDGSFQRIKHAWIAGSANELIEVCTNVGTLPKCTLDHPFILANGEERLASRLRPDDVLASNHVTQIKVMSTRRSVVEQKEGKIVYDIEVEKNHNFGIPLDNSNIVYVHNSEYLHRNNTSCNLSSINLYRFYNPETKTIDAKSIHTAARLAMICADLNVERGGFPIPEIAEGTYRYRTTGIGYANLGGLLMALGIPYDSDDGRWVASQVTSLLTAACWETSAEMGRELGAYFAHEGTKDSLHKVLNLHALSHKLSIEIAKNQHNINETIDNLYTENKNKLPEAQGLTGRDAFKAYLSNFSEKTLISESAQNLAKEVNSLASASWNIVNNHPPYRNSFVSCIAPTGCLLPNTMITTSKGLLKLSDLGDVQGNQWQDVDFFVDTDEGSKRATKFYINGHAPTRKVRTEHGYTIQGTQSHRIKIFTQNGEMVWKTMNDLAPGDLVPMRMNNLVGLPNRVRLPFLPAFHGNEGDVKAPSHMTHELAEFLGYFMGDGSLHQRGIRLCVTQPDEDVLNHLKALGKKLFNIDGIFDTETKENYWNLEFHSTSLRAWFDACGFSKKQPFEGHLGKGKIPHIPTYILESNDPTIYGSFLRGLFEADGTNSNFLPSVSSSNEEFIHDIMSIMLTLGMPMHLEDRGISQLSGKPLYRLRLRNNHFLKKWNDCAGFIGNRKHTPSTKKFQRAQNERIPMDREMLKGMKIHWTQRATANVSVARGGVTRPIAERLLQHDSTSPAALELKRRLQFTFDVVEENIDGGIQPTFDLSVPDNVTYVANGFISHNTISAPMGIYDQGTTSAEPDYTLVKYKQLSGGGSLKMFNSLALQGLRTQGYNEEFVREAAFEVAGLDGLNVASGDPTKVINHLVKNPSDDMCGPVRLAWKRAVKSSGKTVDSFAAYLEANKWSQTLTDDEKLVIGGSSHPENIPWLKPEHLAAYDCSAVNGDGKRSIHHYGHLKMLGAIQPFISGASSKTVNLPASATLEDIKESFVSCHKFGVKCIAVFRADSKANAVFFVDTPETRKLKAPYVWEKLLAETKDAMAAVVADASKPRQRKLKGRRISETVKFQISGQLKGFLTVGVYPDGTCGEVFGRLGQVGSFASSMFEAYCKLLSTSLQFGVPLPDLIDDFRGMAFEPSGFSKIGDDSESGNSEAIRSCASVVDLTVKTLEWLFPAENEYRLRDMTGNPVGFPWSSNTAIAPIAPTEQPLMAISERSKPVATAVKKTSLNSAAICPKCHSLGYVQDGKCKVCRNCGYKDGGCGE